MSHPIFFFQAVVVFLTPTVFGWLVMRRILREHYWMLLFPGSIVIGATALMGLVNELRYWLEMPVAAWFAYKCLILLSIALVLFTKPTRFGPRFGGHRGNCIGPIVAAAGTLVTAFFFGLPAAHGILNDAWWFHYPAATLVQDINRFPLPSVFALDDPLYYHFGPDILAATWSSVLDLRVQTGFVISICIFAPAAFLLAYAVLLRACRSQFGALAAASFLVVGGNLLFLHLRPSDFGHPLGIIEQLNSRSVDGLIKLMFTPSQCCGMAVLLVGLVMFRHFYCRPSLLLGTLLGLWMGMLTLIAEWFFVPLMLAVAICLIWKWLKGRSERKRAATRNRRPWLFACPMILALSVGFFNNSYVSGLFGHYWLHTSTMAERGPARLAELSSPLDQIPAPKPSAAPVWTPPPLLPLGVNLAHFAKVPSWSAAGSSSASFVSFFSFRFFCEISPVILLGIPFGVWLCFARPGPVAGVLTVFAVLSMIPPLFLDWGYRSTDFLRFFTGAYSFSALLLGWLVGWGWRRFSWVGRTGIIAICALTLANSLFIGLQGLHPSTFAAVQDITARGASLPVEGVKGAQDPASMRDSSSSSARPEAFAKLAEDARSYLYPLTFGRDRAIVIVPLDQLPPTEVFPEWLKLATLSHVQLPIGWHWSASLYSGYYRESVTSLTAASIAALGARWIIVSNLFLPVTPPAVTEALKDRSRFAPARSFTEGDYYLKIYRVANLPGASPASD
jgi:hypothetical protein